MAVWKVIGASSLSAMASTMATATMSGESGEGSVSVRSQRRASPRASQTVMRGRMPRRR
jgi:hypothetical protein